tara:strand:+ start:270 stop:872 length:603 start_codon:yes stop_codon:yes gene_type:complete
MSKKKVFQYSLLTLLFLVSFLFYKNYFASELKDSKSDITEKLDIEKDWEPNQKQSDKNLIENLKYVSEDLLGNTYTVTAQSATLKEKKINEVEMFEVNAEISKKDQEIIYIYSKNANYNKINHNTIFRDEVNVKYGEQRIDSKILKLNFKDNLIEILDNVYYVNKNTKINADKVEIDLLYRKLKISMINNKDKVNIVSKY